MANQDQDQNLQENGQTENKENAIPEGLNMNESMTYLRRPKAVKA